MAFFSRQKDPLEPLPADDVPFASLNRTQRTSRARAKSKTAFDAEQDAPAPLDPAEASKTRARRRLIGAVALALAAIVFVPMLFDRTPTQPVDDIAVQIPDRDTPFDGRGKAPLQSTTPLPVTPAPVQPEAPKTAPVSTPSAEPVAETKAPETPPVVTKPVEKAIEKPVEKAAPKVDKTDKPVEKTAEKSAEKPADNPTDDPRAIAALEGKSATPAATPAAAAPAKGYAVQVAAFSIADKAKTLREQLAGNGFKAYTEPLNTAQGPRTRVRLGPFASREAAEKAREKLRTMKLDGSVVPL